MVHTPEGTLEELQAARRSRRSEQAERRNASLPISVLKIFADRDMVDRENRPLRELGASMEALQIAAQKGVRMDTKECRYPGTPSRFEANSNEGHLLNASGLKQVSTHMNGFKNEIATLRLILLKGRPADTVLSLEEVHDLGIFAACLPYFLTWKSDQPFTQGTLPAELSVLFKSIIGINALTTRALMDKEENGAHYMGVEQLVALGEANNMFVSATGRVCAAPPAMMIETLQAIIAGKGLPSPNQSSEIAKLNLPIEAVNLFSKIYWQVHGLTMGFDLLSGKVISEVAEILMAVANSGLTHAKGIIKIRSAAETFVKTATVYADALTPLEPMANALLGRKYRNRIISAQELDEQANPKTTMDHIMQAVDLIQRHEQAHTPKFRNR